MDVAAHLQRWQLARVLIHLLLLLSISIIVIAVLLCVLCLPLII
jgi:hypothetical protein